MSVSTPPRGADWGAAAYVPRIVLRHLQDDPADVLVGLADRHEADVLVIGNRGMHRKVLGSVPNSVTHKANCTVFLVKTT